MSRAKSWLTQLVSSTFIRFLLIFFVGVVTTLAWQAYSDAGREAVAGWCLSIAPRAMPITQDISSSPDLRSVSSPPVSQDVSSSPVAQSVSSSAEERVPVPPDPLKATSDLLKSTSQALAAIRESIDKLAAELTRLQTADRGPPPERASVASGLPPASKPPSRAPPAR